MQGEEKNAVREMTCISCPVGCILQVSDVNGKIKVKGNSCKRGEIYGASEFVNPVRMVTSLMRVEGGGKPTPVRLSAPVPKPQIGSVLREIAGKKAPPSAKRGDVLIRNVAGTGCDVIATADAPG